METSKSDNEAPANPIRVAVAGCGHWGRNLVRNFHQLGALALVCEPNPQARSLAQSLAPEARLCSNVDEALGSDVRAVVLATPAETHHRLARSALAAGKDVLVEKPLALTYAQGRELVEQARAAGAILMVGHVLEYDPAVTRLGAMARGGQLGKLQYIYSNRLSLGKIRREENILWSFAPHDVAVILSLVEDEPLQVIATGGSYIQPNVADVTVTTLLFNNGVRAHIHVSWLHPFKEQRLVVIGSKKMASFDGVRKELRLYDRRVEWREGEPIPIKGEGEPIPFGDEEPLRLECEAFLEAVRTRRAPLTDGASGLRVLKVLNAAQRSLMMNGEPVTYPLETLTV